MSTVPHKVIYTYEEYVSFENGSNVKHEFLDGQIYAMAGGTAEHAALAAASIGQLYAQLRGSECVPFTSDLRVHTNSGLTTYPDVSVICGRAEYNEVDKRGATNPILIIEVMSRSTAEYDAGEKLEHYKTLQTLKQYVLVSHREHSLTVWTREEDAWQSVRVREGEVANLEAIRATLDVRELYETAARVT